MSSGYERSSGGDFDPVSAIVYGPNRQAEASGEAAPIDADPIQILQTRIKSPRGLFTSERNNQGHGFSVSDMAIEVRNEGGGDRLTAAMWIVHRGTSYWIKGVLRKDYKAGTTIYQVTTQNDFSQVQ